jgi:nucleotide-binding universal stress UspA family protein
MYQRILVGIDFSDTSEEAARWAVSRFPTAEIVLFHSVEKFTIPGYLRRALGEELDVFLEKELDIRANLEALADRLGIEPRIEMRQGWTPDTLTTAVQDLDIELVVIGAHQQRTWPTDETRNNTRAVVRKSQVPVLVWRAIRHERDRTILGALSLRDEGIKVSETAAAYADYFSTRLVLLHAMPGTLQAYLRAVSSPAKVEETLGRIEQGARQDVEATVPAALRDRLNVKVVVGRGRPIVAHLLNTAETEDVDLIVIGKALAPGIAAKVLIGGTTSQVIEEANCSVLVVPL